MKKLIFFLCTMALAISTYSQTTGNPKIPGSYPSYEKMILDDRAKISNAPSAALLDWQQRNPELYKWEKEGGKYKDEIEDEMSRKEAMQQKIMRTNALGDAFRLIIEGTGAAAGATTTPRSALFNREQSTSHATTIRGRLTKRTLTSVS